MTCFDCLRPVLVAQLPTLRCSSPPVCCSSTLTSHINHRYHHISPQPHTNLVSIFNCSSKFCAVACAIVDWDKFDNNTPFPAPTTAKLTSQLAIQLATLTGFFDRLMRLLTRILTRSIAMPKEKATRKTKAKVADAGGKKKKGMPIGRLTRRAPH